MLIGAVIFLSLVVVLLAVPVTLTYQLLWRETLSANVRLTWAFGLVRADLSPDTESSRPDTPEVSHPKPGRQDKGTDKKTSFLAAIRQRSFVRRIFRFIADVWRAIRKKDVQLLVRVGLGDPADTGRLWAAFGPLSGFLANLRDIRVWIEPDFVDATFEVNSSGTMRIIPLQITFLALGLLCSPSIWRGIILMRASG